ncbi:MAG: putative Clavaminate synthase-like [Myxococcaceae bacterium]|nr:putative Clavaminate synthase-like [Myxococcaceae bacterium]
MSRIMPGLPFWPRTTGSVLTYQADELSPELFARHVRTNTPCVIRGVARKWPAVERWTPEYLAKNCDPDGTGMLYDKPVKHEWGYFWSDEPEDKAALASQHKASDFFKSTEHAVIRLPFPPLKPELLADVDDFRFPFRPAPPKKAKSSYSEQIVYLYQGGSFTDFHTHDGFEAVMCQVRGTKELLILPPTIDVWRALAPTLDQYDNSFEVPHGKFPAFDALRPTLVRVEAGDVVYIPAWWWHAVEAVDDDFGITLPNWWTSPWRVRFDPSIPQLDHFLWKGLPKEVASLSTWMKNPKANAWRTMFLAAYFASSLPVLTSVMSGSQFGRSPALGRAERDARYLKRMERIARERMKMTNARAAEWARDEFKAKFGREPERDAA